MSNMDVVVIFWCLTFTYLPLGYCSPMDERMEKVGYIINELRSRNAAMSKQISDIENSIDKGNDDITKLEKRVLLLDKAKTDLDDRYQVLKNRIYLTDRQKDISKRQLHTPTICFTAVIAKTDLTNLNSGQPIVFDQAITNLGGAYDVTSGEFTAPISGLYVFNMDIMVQQGENEYLQFVKDNSHVMYNYAHASGALHDESSSREVVLDLKTGNKVWVRTSPGAHHGSGNLHGNGFSTFSGFLLAVTE